MTVKIKFHFIAQLFSFNIFGYGFEFQSTLAMQPAQGSLRLSLNGAGEAVSCQGPLQVFVTSF